MSDTKTDILNCAEQLMRTRGYNGFSYADVADAVGTTRANIHHHFRSKEDLGEALIVKTQSTMGQSLADQQDHPALSQLRHYIGIFEQSVDDNLVCLCGMLLAEDDGLPKQLRATNQGFVDWQLAWMTEVLTSGRTRGEIDFDGRPEDQANFIYSAIQGAHIVAKSRRDRDGFAAAMQQLLDQLND